MSDGAATAARVLGAALLLTVLAAEAAVAIPYFARRYGVPCSQCHVTPPRLNAFGELYRQGGYAWPAGAARRTVPLAVWLSGRSDTPPTQAQTDAARAYLNRVELISGGEVTNWLSYFVEWRALSQEVRGDGTLRDRSGRFEDLFLVAGTDRLQLTAGQFRQIDQVDVSLRLSVSEPLVLSSGLGGVGAGTAREVALRGFSPAARSPAVRGAWRVPAGGGWTWTLSASLPMPGEFSIPVTREARTEASNEFELRAKGVVLETFVRRGLWSWGGHAFYDDGDRYLANAVATGEVARFYWTGIAGVRRQGDVAHGQWSAELEYVPSYHVAFGTRLEDRAGDGAPRAIVPYVNLHFPGTSWTVRFTAERRLQRGRERTLLELGTVF